MPTSLSGLNEEVKAYYFSVSIIAKDIDTILTFVEKLYGTGGVSSRVLYIESLAITGINAQGVSADLAIYTFYRPQA